MAMEEYSSVMVPIFVTLGSLGILRPYFLEGFIIFSFVLLVSLFLLGKFFEKMNLKGYYDIILASISIIFAFAYFQKLTILFIITGILVLSYSMYIIFTGMQEIKCAC